MNTNQPVDTADETGVYSILEPRQLSRAEMRVIRIMRDVDKRGKSWMLVLCGNSAGVRVHETMPPRWERK